jgi:hypothetical protein
MASREEIRAHFQQVQGLLQGVLNSASGLIRPGDVNSSERLCAELQAVKDAVAKLEELWEQSLEQ